MIATSAFDMGVNISDIRLIIVSQLPFSVASFYQMVGRAGPGATANAQRHCCSGMTPIFR